jgi:hypothetical protein
MKYVAGIATCAAVLFVFSVLAVLIGIPTAGIGFIVIQGVLWIDVMPKAWKWATSKFEPADEKDSESA